MKARRKMRYTKTFLQGKVKDWGMSRKSLRKPMGSRIESKTSQRTVRPSGEVHEQGY